MQQSFTASELPTLCDQLARRDNDLAAIITEYGYPPFWSRPNSYETLVHIILEQQVSLASARAALDKLRQRLGAEITPQALLGIADDEFMGLYVSRQKKTYLRGLAQAIIDGSLQLDDVADISDTEVRARLTALKGIGDWTADIYLIMVLHRPDIFPLGDVAAMTALRQVKNLPKTVTRDKLTAITDGWQPYRTIAAMLLWHDYLSRRQRSY